MAPNKAALEKATLEKQLNRLTKAFTATVLDIKLGVQENWFPAAASVSGHIDLVENYYTKIKLQFGSLDEKYPEDPILEGKVSERNMQYSYVRKEYKSVQRDLLSAKAGLQMEANAAPVLSAAQETENIKVQ